MRLVYVVDTLKLSLGFRWLINAGKATADLPGWEHGTHVGLHMVGLWDHVNNKEEEILLCGNGC
jgi:hypothetical protein